MLFDNYRGLPNMGRILDGVTAMMRGNGLKKVLAFMLLAGVLAVSGCGRKGPLEPPPGSISPSTSSSDKASEPAAEDNRIILDALI